MFISLSSIGLSGLYLTPEFYFLKRNKRSHNKPYKDIQHLVQKTLFSISLLLGVALSSHTGHQTSIFNFVFCTF